MWGAQCAVVLPRKGCTSLLTRVASTMAAYSTCLVTAARNVVGSVSSFADAGFHSLESVSALHC